jgi:uncharacterized protein YbbK (DUF523 family)
MTRILISACLLGRIVRYDGRRLVVLPEIPRPWRATGRVIPFCPEMAGGLPVPRPPAELTGCSGDDVLRGSGTVMNCNGADVTGAFLAGARATLAAARHHRVVAAVLKDGSPSCGSRRVYDGSFTGVSRPGRGVTAALLAENKVTVFSEAQMTEAVAFMAAWNGAALSSL